MRSLALRRVVPELARHRGQPGGRATTPRRYGDRPYDDFVEPFLDGHARLGARAVGRPVRGRRRPLRGARHQAPRRRAALAERHTATRTRRGGGASAISSATWPRRCGPAACASAPTTRAASTGPSAGCRCTTSRRCSAPSRRPTEYLAYADAHWRRADRPLRARRALERHRLPGRGRPRRRCSSATTRRCPHGVVNNRFDWMRQTAGAVHCDFVTPEYSTKGDAGAGSGRAPAASARSFGYNREEDESTYLSADDAGADVRRRRRPRRQPAPQRRPQRRRHDPVACRRSGCSRSAGGSAPTATPSTAPARGPAPTARPARATTSATRRGTARSSPSSAARPASDVVELDVSLEPVPPSTSSATTPRCRGSRRAPAVG